MYMKPFLTVKKPLFQPSECKLDGFAPTYFASEGGDSNTFTLVYNYIWSTYQEGQEESGKVALPKEVCDVLSDALSRIATNCVRAHISLYNFTSIDSVDITLEGSIELGSKYKTIMPTGGGGKVGVSFSVKTTNALKNKVREQNDFIEMAAFTILTDKKAVTSSSNGEEISLDSAMNGKKITFAAFFSQLVRKMANELAREHYNKKFAEERFPVFESF